MTAEAAARGPVTFVIDWMGRPHTSNKERQLHRFALATIHRTWREAGTQAARIAKLRDLPPCAVTFQARYPSGNLPDTGAIAPTGKCIIDGLVDAGVWPDDKAEWVTEERYLPPIKAPGQPAVIVTLTPVVPS